jgi:hypothetical protein
MRFSPFHRSPEQSPMAESQQFGNGWFSVSERIQSINRFGSGLSERLISQE